MTEHERLAHSAPTDGEDFDFLIDTIIWMTGSSDFSPDGPGGAEWIRRRDRFDAICHRHPALDRPADRAGAEPGAMPAIQAPYSGSFDVKPFAHGKTDMPWGMHDCPRCSPTYGPCAIHRNRSAVESTPAANKMVGQGYRIPDRRPDETTADRLRALFGPLANHVWRGVHRFRHDEPEYIVARTLLAEFDELLATLADSAGMDENARQLIEEYDALLEALHADKHPAGTCDCLPKSLENPKGRTCQLHSWLAVHGTTTDRVGDES